MDFVRYRLPPILVNIFATVGVIGLLGAIFLPWYQTEMHPPTDSCTVTVFNHVFFEYVSCGSCNSTACFEVAGEKSGLVFDNAVVVSAVTWGCCVLSLLLVLFTGALAWLRLLDGKMRYVARLFLMAALFFNVASILVYLAINQAISSDFKSQTDMSCPLELCKKFVGSNDGMFVYWGPSTGWIASTIATFFVILTSLFTLCLPGEPLNKNEVSTTAGY